MFRLTIEREKIEGQVLALNQKTAKCLAAKELVLQKRRVLRVAVRLNATHAWYTDSSTIR